MWRDMLRYTNGKYLTSPPNMIFRTFVTPNYLSSPLWFEGVMKVLKSFLLSSPMVYGGDGGKLRVTKV